MTRRQLISIYAITIFMMVWGFDIINIIKFKDRLSFKDFISPFAITQTLYAACTFWLARVIFLRFFIPRKFLQLGLALIGLLCFFILFRYTLEEVLYPMFFNLRNYNPRTSIQYYILDNIYFGLVYLLLGFLIFLLERQVGTQKKENELLQKNRDAELQFLRSQINPHFLFNTLNNIYSLVFEKSDKAPAAMLKLSDLMRYMLYEKKERVPLAKEWEYIQNFISLQTLRFDHAFPLDMQFEGAATTNEIPPYLLIPFVENAFKHGDFRDPEHPLRIKLTSSSEGLVLETENKIGQQQKEEAGGVGLDNVRRRLDLIFPGKHTLETIRENGQYRVRLALIY